MPGYAKWHWYGVAKKRSIYEVPYAVHIPFVLAQTQAGATVIPQSGYRVPLDEHQIIHDFGLLPANTDELALEHYTFRAYPSIAFSAQGLENTEPFYGCGEAVGYCDPDGTYHLVGSEGHTYMARVLTAKVYPFEQWQKFNHYQIGSFFGKNIHAEHLYTMGWVGVSDGGIIMRGNKALTLAQTETLRSLAENVFAKIVDDARWGSRGMVAAERLLDALEEG